MKEPYIQGQAFSDWAGPQIMRGRRFPGGGGREQASQIKRLLAGLNAKNLYVSVVPKAGLEPARA